MPQDALQMPGQAQGHSLVVRPSSGLAIAGNGLLGAASAIGFSGRRAGRVSTADVRRVQCAGSDFPLVFTAVVTVRSPSPGSMPKPAAYSVGPNQPMADA